MTSSGLLTMKLPLGADEPHGPCTSRRDSRGDGKSFATVPQRAADTDTLRNQVRRI